MEELLLEMIISDLKGKIEICQLIIDV